METLIGFAVGYLLGVRHGRDGLRKTREALNVIRKSPAVRQLVVAGAAIVGSVAMQVTGGGAGAMVGGISRKAGQLFGDRKERAA
jgi:hypothetical protein